MNIDLYRKLMSWRNEQAKREGVESYRVFPNATLEALATALPKNKEEMLCIKGLKEAKFGRYGQMLLQIITENNPSTSPFQGGGREGFEDESETSPQSPPLKGGEEDLPLSVSQFLDALNLGLSGMAARIKGEVSSVDVRDRVVYFSIKDSQDESLVSCLIFRSQYQISGVNIVVGDEIIIEGVPEIYKPNGRLSLKVSIIELAGEGALKKAYDELFRKFETEGLMAPEKKRMLSEFPSRIALITSEQGAAIGDFTMNLGQIGLKVDFYPTSVEGKKAVFEILSAIKFFNRHPEKYDLLVVIRGGGSFESLQAFNNETLVREVATSQIPTLLGVGHERDVTLAALVSDMMVSTPTATARTIREPFERARQVVGHAQSLLFERFGRELSEKYVQLSKAEQSIELAFPKLRERFERAEQSLFRSLDQLRFTIEQAKNFLTASEESVSLGFARMNDSIRQALLRMEEKLHEYDPNRALALGYGLIHSGGQLIRSITSVKKGDSIDIQVADGRIAAEVKQISSIS